VSEEVFGADKLSDTQPKQAQTPEPQQEALVRQESTIRLLRQQQVFGDKRMVAVSKSVGRLLAGQIQYDQQIDRLQLQIEGSDW
jgi:hypothetical protein